MEPDVNVLERILDGRMKPTNLQLALLRNITGDFSKELEIGQGGFATVYKGVLPYGNVAVKRIRNSYTIDEKLFYGEVDSLLTINHQNIVRFLGFCASTEQIAIKIEGSRGHIYAEVRERLLCFEYITNGSLQNHITDELRGLEWDTRYRIIRGICEGLRYLHVEKHIYHMDLKPANILLDDDMIPKITDFGLSRLDEKSQTMSVDRCGSLGYCAPEYRCRGKMSFKTDIYGLGIIIIELVTGDKDIPDNSKNNVLRRWRHRWKKTGKETALGYEQVTKCIEIGLLCQEIDPCKRPFIWEIISDLDKMEDTIGQVGTANKSAVGQIIPFSEDDMLGIEPLELYVPFELDKQMSCSLQLSNDTDFYIAFNIEKMSPLLCCTQPNKGIVVPQSKCSVDITMQPRDKAPRDMRLANEFIVQSTKVNNGLAVQDITVNMFNKETDNVVDELNLDVVFDARLEQKRLRSDVPENLEGAETQISQEPPAEWAPEGPPDLASGLDDGNLPYPYLPTVLEEPSSSFSEVAEDDPLPAIDGLRITGEAFPGREIQASGYSINGTTSCNFEWVRHLEDGSVNYIVGTRQPTYLVTADDVDSLLAIEVQPLDDRKRKGEIVKVYANEQRKITCDPEMKEHIKKILSIGHVSYEVLLPVRFIDMWEPAVLAIKREGYSIKCNGQRGVVITEKFQQATAINIPYGRPIEFSIQSADGAEYNLKTAENSPSRDSIVLILRLFRMKAVEKSKGRKKGIFFK